MLTFLIVSYLVGVVLVLLFFRGAQVNVDDDAVLDKRTVERLYAHQSVAESTQEPPPPPTSESALMFRPKSSPGG